MAAPHESRELCFRRPARQRDQFRAEGSYPFEFDLPAKLPHNWKGTFTPIANNVETLIPPAGHLALTPNAVASQTVGAALNFSPTVIDVSGAAVTNTPVVRM